MSKKKNRKIIPYRKPHNINVGMIIFGIIFLYMLFNIFAYFRKDHVQFYEVMEGGIVNNKQYTGLILREEQVRNAQHNGYINYYLREGKRASVGTRIYSLDETGRLDSLLKENGVEDAALPEENLADIKKQLSSYVLSRSDEDFGSIYDTRYSLEAAVMEYSSFSALDQLDKISQDSSLVFEQVRADISGVVSYGIDSYESLQPSDVEADSFNKANYVKNIHKSGDLIESGTPAYKIASSENWSIVFPLSSEDAALYADKTSLTIDFRDYDLTTTAAYSTFTGKDGAVYGKLDMNRYMAQFIMDRFIEFEIQQPQAKGLKIPVTAVTEKNFYMVPKSYAAQGGDSTDIGFNKEVYSADGTSVLFVPLNEDFEDDEFYYIAVDENGDFKSGDYIVRPDSSDRYQIGRTSSLKGVFNINKGYTVFTQVEILDSSNEYYTVKNNVTYGLSVYDHIVLDASSVGEGQLLYQ